MECSKVLFIESPTGKLLIPALGKNNLMILFGSEQHIQFTAFTQLDRKSLHIFHGLVLKDMHDQIALCSG
ncbi:hypothetical protein D3C80_2113900 [compost metagenome]